MRTAIVIPARYASSRLPGKPLLKATGKCTNGAIEGTPLLLTMNSM